MSGPRARQTVEALLLVGVGDTHGDFAPLFAAAEREPDAHALLQVGDLTAGKVGRESHEDDDPRVLAGLPRPLIWVHGNHEHWAYLGLDPDPLAQRRASSIGIHLWPGDAYVVPGTRIGVVGLPGNYAPTWYDKPKPFPGDRVRHFNADDVAALERFERPSVLMMHEAFRGQGPGRLGAMGVPVLTPLVRRLQPEVCLTGHHHTLLIAEHGPTLAIALPRAQAGYVRLWFAPDGRRLGWEYIPFES